MVHVWILSKRVNYRILLEVSLLIDVKVKMIRNIKK